jgi:hypothetical protein
MSEREWRRIANGSRDRNEAVRPVWDSARAIAEPIVSLYAACKLSLNEKTRGVAVL